MSWIQLTRARQYQTLSLQWTQLSQESREVNFTDSLEFEGMFVIAALDSFILPSWQSEYSGEDTCAFKRKPRYLEKRILDLRGRQEVNIYHEKLIKSHKEYNAFQVELSVSHWLRIHAGCWCMLIDR